MARSTINFEYDGKEYSLCFTIDTLKKLEKNGFSFGNIEDHALSAAEDLFCAAFNTNHKDTSMNLRKKIYSELSEESDNDDTLLEALISMVNECVESMKPKGNTRWRKIQG